MSTVTRLRMRLRNQNMFIRTADGDGENGLIVKCGLAELAGSGKGGVAL